MEAALPTSEVSDAPPASSSAGLENDQAAISKPDGAPVEQLTAAECVELLRSVLALYEKERTVKAYKELQRVKESRQLGAGWEEVDRIFEENGLLFQRISEEAARTLTLLEELSSDESWQMCRDENGIQALYKQKEDSPCHYLQMRGVIDCPAFEVLSVINEIDLYQKWVLMVQDSSVHLDISPYKRIIRMTFSMPSPLSWVISDRDMLLYGYGVDMMEEGKVVAMAHSPSEEYLQRLKEEFDFDAPDPGDTIRMDCRLSGMVCTPISRTKTQVQVVTNVDPKVVLPYWIINATTTKFAHMMFNLLSEQARNLDEEYQSRISAEGSLYDDIRQKLDQLFEEQGIVE